MRIYHECRLAPLLLLRNDKGARQKKHALHILREFDYWLLFSSHPSSFSSPQVISFDFWIINFHDTSQIQPPELLSDLCLLRRRHLPWNLRRCLRNLWGLCHGRRLRWNVWRQLGTHALAASMIRWLQLIGGLAVDFCCLMLGFLKQQTINRWIKIAGWICGPLLFNPILPHKTHRIFRAVAMPNKKINCIHHFPSNPPLFGLLCLWNHCRRPEHQNMTSFLVDCFFRLKPEREKSHHPKRQEHAWNRHCPQNTQMNLPLKLRSFNFWQFQSLRVESSVGDEGELPRWAIWSYKSGWSWSDPPSHSWNKNLRAFLYTSSDIISYLTPNVWHVCNRHDIYRYIIIYTHLTTSGVFPMAHASSETTWITAVPQTCSVRIPILSKGRSAILQNSTGF